MVNILLGFKLFLKYGYSSHFNDTPAMQAMKSIAKVYDILNHIVNDTKAYKVAISKVCHVCEVPYAEMIYDNHVEGEERYNSKYNRLQLDDAIVRELTMVGKGRMIAVNVGDLKEGLTKDLYTSEGITYSETHKIIQVNQYLYVLVVHYKLPIANINESEMSKILQYKSKLIQLFEDNRDKL